MRLFLTFVFTQLLLISCASNDDSQEQEQEHKARAAIASQYILPVDSIPELTPEQEAGLDVLSTLQTSTDEKHKIYSTFPGFPDRCYPPDTILKISRSEFLTAMQNFVTKNCTYMKAEKRDEMAIAASLVQEEYIVFHCADRSSPSSNASELPMHGTWVLPNIVGRRNLTIVW